MSAGNEDKNVSTAECRFFDFKDKTIPKPSINRGKAYFQCTYVFCDFHPYVRMNIELICVKIRRSGSSG